MSTADEHVTTRTDRHFDGFLSGALALHDVMKRVPHPYNAVASMASSWAHDFVGFAQWQQRERASLLERLHAAESEVERLRAAEREVSA